MALDTSLLNIQHYKVRIKGKVEQSSVVAVEKGAFWSPTTTVTNFTLFTNPSARAGYDTRSIFKAKFNRFEFRVFLLLDKLPLQG